MMWRLLGRAAMLAVVLAVAVLSIACDNTSVGMGIVVSDPHPPGGYGQWGQGSTWHGSPVWP